ncbi:WD40/YVTN/BNR-like repeat-containing protein [Uliginosibacterium sp. H1]|uniref:WD40/YVTN/BNR-like repeat-containing protein n=1 Tax=Uliginosibacterium sp. H1 TaxID=3114757 RepID=UPI002E190184|nr:YCF48-related protein [Uliginosibacterium sp. H1]
MPNRLSSHVWRLSASILLPVLVLVGCRDAEPPRATPGYRAEVINPTLVRGMSVDDGSIQLAWGSDGTILRSTDNQQWQQASSPVTADLNRGGTDGKVLIIVGAAGAILRSEDKGQTWTQVRHDGMESDLQALTFHAPTRTWITAGTQGVILHSRDDGKTWTAQKASQPFKLESLYADPASQRVWLGGPEGMLGRSDDGGQNWAIVSLGIDTPITGFYRHGETLIATSAQGRFYVSQDKGDNWAFLQLPTRAFFTDTAYDPGHRTIVMSGHTGDVAVSADEGKSWRLVEATFHGSKNYLSTVQFDPRSKGLIAAGHHGTLLRSADGGLSWTAALPAGTAGNFQGMLYDAKRGTLALLGDGGHLHASQDAGKTWATLSARLTDYQREVIATPDGKGFVTAGQVGAMYLAGHDGNDWEVLRLRYPNENTPPSYRALELSPSGKALLAAGPPGTIMRSADQGRSWQVTLAIPLEKGEALVKLIPDARHKTTVAVEVFGGLKVSTDDGKSWQEQRVDAGGRELWHGAATDDGTVVITGNGGVIVRGDPRSKQWQVVPSGTEHGLYGSHYDPASRNVFAVGQGGTILRSTDSGRQWQSVGTGGEHGLRRMLTDPRTQALVAFGEGGLIMRSTDQGQTWQRVESGTTEELRTSAVEPGTRNLLLTGRQGTLLRSTDSGQTWQAIDTHTQRHFRSIAINPATKTLMLVGERTVRLVPDDAAPAP